LWPTSLPLTGRQVAARVPHRSQEAVSVALDRLVGQGIVHRQEPGRAYLHTPNYEHLAVAALVGLRAALIDRLRTHLSAWSPPPHHASLFGSTARGDGDAGSDVDLLIIRPDAVDDEDAAWRRQVDDLQRDGVDLAGVPLRKALGRRRSGDEPAILLGRAAHN
jgi:predicted nucleotidyltransferase